MRWAAALDPDSWMGRRVQEGKGPHPVRGTEGPSRPPLPAPPVGETLYLVTGILDDPRKPAVATEPLSLGALDALSAVERRASNDAVGLYRLASYAYSRRDHWDAAETRDYWLAHLLAWPKAARRPGNAESLALSVTVARTIGLSADESLTAATQAGSPAELRKRHVPELAERMLDEAEGTGELVYLPRVVTETEYRARPLLGGIRTLSPLEEARLVQPSAESVATVSNGDDALKRARGPR